MSLYNMLHGVNPATFFILPMLGEKHPDSYPRFRDCFVVEHKGKKAISVYTRVGGGNRGQGFGEEELYHHPNFITTEDDDFDNTYASYLFSVPDEWASDFEKILDGHIAEVSVEYKDRLRKVFPKLEAKFDEMFGEQSQGETNVEGKP